MFSVALGIDTNNFAKLIWGGGGLHGLQLVKELAIFYIDVELDSLLVVKWLKEKVCKTWYLEDFSEEVMGVL